MYYFYGIFLDLIIIRNEYRRVLFQLTFICRNKTQHTQIYVIWSR